MGAAIACTMACYRILHWRNIPSLVEAYDGRQTACVALSQRFQDLIDAVAMREGASESGAYLEGWGHSPEQERPGRPEEVAAQVAAELEARFQELVQQRFLGTA